MTPAPWKLSVHGDGYHVTGETHGQWTKVATVHGMRPDDGRLIAAAPDLLELARQYAMECASCDGQGRRITINSPDPHGWEDCSDCSDIRAVIAKATGEHS